MTDLFKDRAADYDQRPVPQQISEGVTAAMLATVPMGPETRVLDFGAGTGLLCAKIAPHVAHVVAVDISEAMLAADRKNRATFGTGASRAAGPSAWRGTLNTCSVSSTRSDSRAPLRGRAGENPATAARAISQAPQQHSL